MPDYRNTSMCHADRDGDCYYKRCPQVRDNEPWANGRHCPLDKLGPGEMSEAKARRLARQIINKPEK